MADVFDITPGLIERVDEYYRARCMANASLPRLAKKLEEGKATYDDAYKYAEAIGKARADAFAHEVSSDVLPDGRMYYNIADRLMTETLSSDHEVVSAYATGVQELINQKSGINLAAQTADLDEDRIKGFVEGICNAEVYDDVAWKLGEPVVTHARTVVDDTVKKNAEFQGRAGVKATVIRNGTSKCCEWCSDLAGDYTYPNVPREVFQRHDNCKCTVDYEGRRLSAYTVKDGNSIWGVRDTHTFRDLGEQERIEARKKLTSDDGGSSINGKRSPNGHNKDNVMLPDGTWTHLTEGTYLEQVRVIAGRGREREIDVLDVLVDQYPESEPELWQKKKGYGYIDYQDESYKADLHWYEEPHIGKTPMKVKPDAAGNWFYED